MSTSKWTLKLFTLIDTIDGLTPHLFFKHLNLQTSKIYAKKNFRFGVIVFKCYNIYKTYNNVIWKQQNPIALTKFTPLKKNLGVTIECNIIEWHAKRPKSKQSWRKKYSITFILKYIWKFIIVITNFPRVKL